MSEEYLLVDRILKELASAIKPIKKSFGIEVCLRRIPLCPEIEEIKRRLPEFCVRGTAARDSLGELGFLLLNHDPPGEATLQHHDGEEIRPTTAIVAAVSGPDEPHRHIVVRIAYSDKRAQQFLESEAKQLPKEHAGLIMVQMSNAPGGFRTWEPILRRRLQPNLHTRVGALCLFGSGIEATADGHAWVPRAMLISNPNAPRPLPRWIEEQLSRLAPGW